MVRMLIVGIAAAAVVGAAAMKYEPSERVNEETAAAGTEPEPEVDAATECRDVAPEDPYLDDLENGQYAYDMCAEAVASAPDDADLLFRLAMSAMQAEANPEEVLGYLTKAEALGHCESRFYIAEDAWYGREDASQAEEWYKRGAACGDPKAALAIFQPEMFQGSDYADTLGMFYRGEIASLNDATPRPIAASYSRGFVTALGEAFNSDQFQTCWAAKNFRGGEVVYRLKAAEQFDASNFVESWIYEQITPYIGALFFPEFGTKAIDELREAAAAAGRADLIRLTSSGASCDALLIHKIAEGITSFSMAKKSLFEVIKARRHDVQSIDDLRRLALHSQR